MKLISEVFVVLLLFGVSTGLNNGLGQTPQMGWNSWYNFWCKYNETRIRQTIDIIISNGLAAAGYEYINFDDCWQVGRDANGTILADPVAFPNGIKAIADYVHSKKLKFGLYSDAGYKTCGGRPGSLGYEKKDAQTYAEWGVDYLKYDNCNTDGTKPEVRYPVMRDALNATGRPIFYSLCEWGVDTPALWAADVGNSWRTTDDIRDTWDSMTAMIDINNEFADKAGPGGWNDPDMLRIGNGGMSISEYTSYFSLWSISKSPLIIGGDVTNMSQEIFNIYLNTEVIAINQDPLGIQGKKIKVFPSEITNRVLFTRCSSNDPMKQTQQWIFNSNDKTIRSIFNNQCLTIDKTNSNQFITRQCLNNDENQQWTLQEQILLSEMFPFPMKYVNQTIQNNEKNLCLSVEASSEIWSGPLTNGSQAVLFLNRDHANSTTITVNWTDFGWPSNQTGHVRDLWLRKDLGVFSANYTSQSIQPHAIQMIKITPIH